MCCENYRPYFCFVLSSSNSSSILPPKPSLILCSLSFESDELGLSYQKYKIIEMKNGVADMITNGRINIYRNEGI